MNESSSIGLITEKDAAKRLGLTRRGLQNLRATARGPRFCRVSRTCVRYKIEDLDAWVEDHMARSTAEKTVAETKADGGLNA